MGVTVDNGALSDFIVSTDQSSFGSREMERVKLAYSAAGSEAHVPADGDGLQVNLGPNNDVTVTSGTVTLGAGTAAIGKLAANSGVDIGDVDVASLPSLPAGSNAIGKLAANSGVDIGDVDVLSLPSIPAGANDIGSMHLKDADGDDLTFSVPIRISATPSLSVATYAANYSLGTVLSWADAVQGVGGTGHLLSVTITDKDDLDHNGTNGQYAVDFYSASVTVTNNAPYAVASDAEADTYLGTALTTNGLWVDVGPAKVCTIIMGAPLPITCVAEMLYGVLRTVTADSGNSSASGKVVKIHVARD